jgi:hypothetical protein
MNWAPVTMRWPSQATDWVAGLDEAKALASVEIARREGRGAAITPTPPPGRGAAPAAAPRARAPAAMADQLGNPPACLTVTPFQNGMGQGTGYQRFLSAPNLLEQLAAKLVDVDPQRPAGADQFALCILFLSTRYDQFAATLARFNALLPTPDLVRTERRALHLARLEAEKWTLPSGTSGPGWGILPLERCTITQAAQQSLNGQLAMFESYAADSSPLADLGTLTTRKAAQQAARDQGLTDLQNSLANGLPDTTMQVRQIGPGNVTELRRQLLEGTPPGYEWVLCAGLLLLGSEESLSFVKELVGL